MKYNENHKTYWKKVCLHYGERYEDLMAAYEGIREIEREVLDSDKDKRIRAMTLIFPGHNNPGHWWPVLHCRIENAVGDSDFNKIRNFDDKARILAVEFPELDAGEPLATTRKVFNYVSEPPTKKAPTQEAIREAWELAFGYEAPGTMEVKESMEELAAVPF